MVTLTPDQLKDLKREFIEFKINEMTADDMASYIRGIWMLDGSLNDPYELEFKINSYDDNLFIFDRDKTPTSINLYVEWLKWLTNLKSQFPLMAMNCMK